MDTPDRNAKDTRTTSAMRSGRRTQIGVRLQPAGQSEQTVFANVTAVQAAAGTLFLDFGFVEPQALSALARRDQAGEKLPEEVRGRLSCRVAISVDVAAALSRQLGQMLAGRSGPVPAKTRKTR